MSSRSTDTDFLKSVLEDGPATTMGIISRSISERGCGITPHSRAADLRRQLKDGRTVRCRRIGTRDHRGIFLYELVA